MWKAEEDQSTGRRVLWFPNLLPPGRAMVETEKTRTETARRGLKNSFLIHATVSEMGSTGAFDCG